MFKNKLFKELEEKIKETSLLESELKLAKQQIWELQKKIQTKNEEINRLENKLYKLKKEFENSKKIVKYPSGNEYEYKFITFENNSLLGKIRLPKDTIILGITTFPSGRNKPDTYTLKCLVPIEGDEDE